MAVNYFPEGTQAGPLTSQLSANNGACVKLKRLPDGTVLMWDSKDPDGGVFRFTPEQWHWFIGQVVCEAVLADRRTERCYLPLGDDAWFQLVLNPGDGMYHCTHSGHPGVVLKYTEAEILAFVYAATLRQFGPGDWYQPDPLGGKVRVVAFPDRVLAYQSD